TSGTTNAPPLLRGGAFVVRARHRMPQLRSGEEEGDLDLDRTAQRQFRDTDGSASMPPGVAEDLTENLARAVDDAGLTGEALRRGDEAAHTEHTGDAVDSTRGIRCRGERVQGAGARIGLRILRGDLGTELADCRQRAV